MANDLRLPPSGEHGFCDRTKVGEGASCEPSDAKGNWQAPTVAACVAACIKCPRCHFVSFEETGGGCDWFRRCPRLLQAHRATDIGGQHATTYAVRNPDGGLAALQLPKVPPDVTFGGLVVGRLHGSYRHRRSDWSDEERVQHVAVLEGLSATCAAQRAAARQALLVYGTLTTDDAQTRRLRQWHRAAHCAQGESSVLVRYVLSVHEAREGAAAEVDTGVGGAAWAHATARENTTHGDLHVVPSTPHGFGDPAAAAPAGAGCFFKLLSWLQFARRAHRHVPYVGWGDLDSFWRLSRYAETISRHLAPVDAWTQPLVAGAMFYSVRWDFAKHQPVGEGKAFPRLLRLFAGFEARGGGARLSAQERRLTHPFVWPHGASPFVSQALSRLVLESADVLDFMRLYRTSIATDDALQRWARGHKSRNKCMLPTDSTFGLLASFLPSLIAVDLMSFKLNYIWPLFHKCHGPQARHHVRNVHAFHLLWGAKHEPSFWLHLLNVTADPPGHRPLPGRLVCMPGSDGASRRAVAQLAERASSTGTGVSVRIMDPDEAIASLGRLYGRLHPERRSVDRPGGFGPGLDWLLCGVNCHGIASGSPGCGNAWHRASFAEMLDRRR